MLQPSGWDSSIGKLTQESASNENCFSKAELSYTLSTYLSKPQVYRKQRLQIDEKISCHVPEDSYHMLS